MQRTQQFTRKTLISPSTWCSIIFTDDPSIKTETLTASATFRSFLMVSIVYSSVDPSKFTGLHVLLSTAIPIRSLIFFHDTHFTGKKLYELSPQVISFSHLCSMHLIPFSYVSHLPWIHWCILCWPFRWIGWNDGINIVRMSKWSDMNSTHELHLRYNSKHCFLNDLFQMKVVQFVEVWDWKIFWPFEFIVEDAIA